MSAPEAQASATSLLAKAEALKGSDYSMEIWELTGQVLEARSTLEASGPADAHVAGIRPACYRALSELGHNENWVDYPVWFDEPDFNMGDFLCWFLRTRTLGHVEVGQGTAKVTINDVTLQFALQKNIATDDYYADPDSKAAGKVKLAIVAVTWGNQTDRLTTFDQHLQVITLAMTQQGAPFVE